jgi:hypothetical protein
VSPSPPAGAVEVNVLAPTALSELGRQMSARHRDPR